MSGPTVRPRGITPGITPTTLHRFHLLDALRGIAAVFVVFWHAPKVLKPLWLGFPNSYLAVDFFFCLSGFVVAFSYEDRLRARMTLGEFSVARVIRLYPVYLLGSIIILFHHLSIAHLLLHTGMSPYTFAGLATFAVFMVPNLFLNDPGLSLFPLNGPAWSLFLELIANGAFAILVRKRLASTRLLLFLTVLSFGGLIHLAVRFNSVDVGALLPAFWPSFARVGFSFLAGVLVFRLYRKGLGGHILAGLGAVASGLTVLMLLVALTLKFTWTTNPIYAIAVITLLFPPLVFLGAHCRVPASLIPACVFLGDMSYPIYMLHMGFFYFLYGRSIQRIYAAHPHLLPAFLPIFVCVLMLLSWCAGAYVDLPLRRKLTAAYKRARHPKPSAELTTP